MGTEQELARQAPARRWGIHLLFAGTLLVAALSGYVLRFSYQQALAKAATDSANMAAMIEARFDATLRRIQSVLEFSATLPAEALQARHAPAHEASVEARLAALAGNFPEIVNFVIFDAEGDMLYSSRPEQASFSIRNRAYFQHLQRHPDTGILFSDVITGISMKQPLLLQVAPLRTASGRLLGVALASVNLLYFQQQLDKLDVGPRGLIAIRRTEDSRLILRRPQAADEINKPVTTPLSQLIEAGNKTASIRLTSPVDKITRISSARALDQFPFFIGVGIAESDALAGWYIELGITAALMSLLILVAWWYFFRLARDERIRAGLVAERELQNSLSQERAQQTQAILDHVVDGIITIDRFGAIQSFNKSAERIFGHAADAVVGRNVKLLMPEPYHSEHDGYLARYHQSGVPHIIGSGREVLGRRRDGTTFPLDLAVSHSAHLGQPLFIGLVRDITERKRLDQMKSEFVSTVSHELRTPLTSISGALGLVCGGALGPVSEQARPVLDIAYKNSQRLSHLINDLLDMEKLVAGKMRFELQTQAIMPLVEQAIESTQAYAQQYQVRLELKERADGVQVHVDAGRLQQALGNFLSNAVKFSPKDGRVEVVVQRDGAVVRVSVIDHGPGIPREFRQRIFQKFSQADSSDTRQKGGTGLGLAITKELVERMNGQVGFESEEGQGATFHLELPTA